LTINPQIVYNVREHYKQCIHMSIYSKLLATAGVFSMTAAMLSIVPVSAISGELEAPTSTSGNITYCNWVNQFQTSDVQAARQIIGDKAYFYTTENTTTNIVNGKCVANLVANYVPYIAGHKTSFDLTAGGAVNNVKVLNVNPDLLSVTCDGNKTVFRFKDANNDVITYSSVIGANDFKTPVISTETDNVLVVTFEKSDSVADTKVNSATIYVQESSLTGLAAGYLQVTGATSASAYTMVSVTVDKSPATSKLTVDLKAKCDPTDFASSSSSSMSKSSISSTTSTTTSATSKDAMTSSKAVVVTNGPDAGGKGMLTRTGGAN
jgi:hypothetical protein